MEYLKIVESLKFEFKFQVIKARKAVVSNASIWDTAKLLPKSGGDLVKGYKKSSEKVPECESFMHLHLGFDRKVRPL